MKITIYNFKGGVGKTSIALNLALSLDYGVITNDVYSPLERVLPEQHFLKLENKQPIPQLPKEYNIIFDLGGHIDPRAIRALKMSDLTVVPVMNDFINKQVTINAIDEIAAHNDNIVIVANRTEKADYLEIKKTMEQYYKYPIFEIKRSKALSNIFQEKKSIKEMINAGGIKAYNYRKIHQQFEEFIDHIIS